MLVVKARAPNGVLMAISQLPSAHISFPEKWLCHLSAEA